MGEIYQKQTWEDLPSNETPISAERLGHIEEGIYQASVDANKKATTQQAGIVKPDGTTITVDQSGTISAQQQTGNYASKSIYEDTAISLGRKQGTSKGMYSVAAGSGVTASGAVSQAFGDSTTASATYSHAEGHSTSATAECAHAEGNGSTSSGRYSHAEGYKTSAKGVNSHAEGYNNTASGDNTHVEGYNNISAGVGSHVEGYGNKEQAGQNNYVGGSANTLTGGAYCHVSGANSVVMGSGIFSHGQGIDAQSGSWAIVVGQYNDASEVSNAAVVVGGGESSENRKNIFVLSKSGSAKFTGDITVINNGESLSFLAMKGEISGRYNYLESQINALRNQAVQAKVIDTKADLDAWLAVEGNADTLVVGQNIYIIETGTPDYWWDGTGLQALETDKVEIESMTYDETMEILNEVTWEVV